MSRITPGYNFGTTEQVTATKLKLFVEGTTVEDLNWSEVDSSIPRFAMANDTAFSLGPEGTVWWDGVERSLMVQSRWGPVCLWAEYKMETRRFEANLSGYGDIRPWAMVRIDSSGTYSGASNPGFELATGVNSTNLGSRVLGVLQYETATSMSHKRIVMHGVTKVRFADWSQPGDTGHYGGVGDADGQFVKEANTAVDKICGVIISTSKTEASGISNIGWIFLFPNTWRD